MAEISRTFPHRLNLDGTFDSICPDCLRTISNEQFEIDLNPPVKGGVKPGHWGGAKVGQWVAV